MAKQGGELRDASTLGPRGKAPSKCPRTPPIALAPAGTPLARTEILHNARRGTLPHPSCFCPFTVGGARGQQAEGAAHPTGWGAGWRPHMEEGKAVSYSLGGTAETKIKAPKLPPEVAVGTQIHPSHRQDELCTKAAHAAAGREGSGGWAGSGPNPTGSVTSGAEVSTVVPLMLGANYFQASAALCIIGLCPA